MPFIPGSGQWSKHRSKSHRCVLQWRLFQCVAIIRAVDVSSVAVSEPSSGPLGISLATRDAVRVLRWLLAMSWARWATSVSFLLHGTSTGREALLMLLFTSLRTAWQCTGGMLLCPVPAAAVLCGFPGLSVAKGMFYFKLWWASMLSRHPGGLMSPLTLLSLPGGRWEGHTLVIAGDEARGMRENQVQLLGFPVWFWVWDHMATASSCWSMLTASKLLIFLSLIISGQMISSFSCSLGILKPETAWILFPMCVK